MAAVKKNILKKDILRILEDPYLFISRLAIKDKAGKLSSLEPSEEQLEIIRSFEGGSNHLVILKARQIGSSTIVSAYLFWKWFISKEPITIAILSHKLASSKHLLEMWFRFYDNLPPALQRELDLRNTTSMRLKDTGAQVIAVSAEGHGGLRSFSANYIHLSEAAFAPNADELKATAMASLNDGRLIQESTANVFGDAHHVDVLKAERGEAGYSLLFFPWTSHSSYRLTPPEGVHFTEEEESLLEAGLDEAQVYWRRLKIEQLGIYKFKREYPLTIDEAYGSSSNAYFSDEDLAEVGLIRLDGTDGVINRILSPHKATSYAIGVDVSAGVGKDYSVITVMDKTTYSITAIWCSNRSSIPDVADVIIHLATEYNEAKVLIEENNIGSALLLEMRNRGYSNLWHHPITGKDWNTNFKTKFQMFEELKEAIRQGAIRELDLQTLTELKAFYINDRGNIDYPSNLPTHGDSVIALALCVQCLKQVTLPKQVFLPEWVKSQKYERAVNKYNLHNKRRY
jgi:hypothetical protein